MNVKSINQFNIKNDFKLTDQQMKVLKGGDDGADALVNDGANLGTLDFNG